MLKTGLVTWLVLSGRADFSRLHGPTMPDRKCLLRNLS